MSTPSLLNSSASPNPCATPQGGLLFGHLAEQSPLTGYEPKSLIEGSSEHTPINSPSRNSSFDIDFSDLATTVDASERIDTTDLGQLTSPLSTQEREVSANPFSVSGSPAASSSKQQQAAASSKHCETLARNGFSKHGETCARMHIFFSCRAHMTHNQRNRVTRKQRSTSRNFRRISGYIW